MRLVITGNPGVGKHTSARIISEKMGAEMIDINRVAIENNAIAKKTKLGLEVDLNKLGKIFGKLLESKKDMIIVGHLAPYAIMPDGISIVAVLRRSPCQLEKTLEKRGYSAEKIRENVASEILGVSLYDSLKKFGKRKVVEFDTTDKMPDQTADEIMRALKRKPKPVEIDWLAMVSEKEMQKFFEY